MGQCEDVPGRLGQQNKGQGNNERGVGAAGYGRAQNRVAYANPGQARQIKCYNCNNIGGQDNVVDDDVDEQPTQYLALNVDNMFQADDCDAFDSDDAVCEHYEVHEMHDDVQPNYVIDSHTGYTSDSNMILYDQVENAKVKQHYKELYDSIKIMRTKHIDQTTALLTKNENLKVQINAKLKCVTIDSITPKVLAPATLREIVEEAKVERPLDRSVASACFYTKHSQELLEYEASRAEAVENIESTIHELGNTFTQLTTMDKSVFIWFCGKEDKCLNKAAATKYYSLEKAK
nr:hypothetical protein [Tanacetum cinerariifolium]